jgi:hypothetical protein
MENPKTDTLYRVWELTTSWINGSLKMISNKDLNESILPGKNHGVWILGHLIESEDELSTFLGKGPMLFPSYIELFGQGSKLEPIEFYPSAEELRTNWKEVISKNEIMLKEMKDSELDEPHCQRIKEDPNDFFQTKGRCIAIWSLHQMYHNGQLAILLSKAGKMKY